MQLAPPLLKDTSPLLTNVFSATLMSRVMINLRVENERAREHLCIVHASQTLSPMITPAAADSTFSIELAPQTDAA
ncbi:hypothetical protein FA95DRAFT_1559844 [Auriscalpium vulgare]|uniref:Uncharacterized protein n=1 Tax=Auriscalpium vulgare TaxID=40419 RepID=A0ACB8RT80_9AGAM|nr:hypothetical protein FA95DRAFT_1559844 [Auriscalpium vulgare]